MMLINPLRNPKGKYQEAFQDFIDISYELSGLERKSIETLAGLGRRIIKEGKRRHEVDSDKFSRLLMHIGYSEALNELLKDNLSVIAREIESGYDGEEGRHYVNFIGGLFFINDGKLTYRKDGNSCDKEEFETNHEIKVTPKNNSIRTPALVSWSIARYIQLTSTRKHRYAKFVGISIGELGIIDGKAKAQSKEDIAVWGEIYARWGCGFKTIKDLNWEAWSDTKPYRVFI